MVPLCVSQYPKLLKIVVASDSGRSYLNDFCHYNTDEVDQKPRLQSFLTLQCLPSASTSTIYQTSGEKMWGISCVQTPTGETQLMPKPFCTSEKAPILYKGVEQQCTHLIFLFSFGREQQPQIARKGLFPWDFWLDEKQGYVGVSWATPSRPAISQLVLDQSEAHLRGRGEGHSHCVPQPSCPTQPALWTFPLLSALFQD